MPSPAIRVENLGKRYTINQDRRYQALRDRLTDLLAAPLRGLSRLRRRPAVATQPAAETTFWALRDVSFEVRPGEVVGVIGRNGAGKSTLLKILSQITEPTVGTVDLYGRVGSLLEVGTGFHPELTGRENIYLNGAILGMKRTEIGRKFDAIVAFAEVEKFLDTPVKHYSSGMYMRLAFAVAAHLEPEILLVDEVLAVGDAAFQKKCLGKMKETARTGRTVFFVSHNMAAIRALCTTCHVYDGGSLVKQGDADPCVREYLVEHCDRSQGGACVDFRRPPSVPMYMTSARLLNVHGSSAAIDLGDPLEVEVAFEADCPIQRPRFGLTLGSEHGDVILNANNHYQKSTDLPRAVTKGMIRCHLGVVPLMPGRYTLSLWFGDQTADHHIEPEALSFDVLERDIWGTGKIPPARAGYLWWPTRFELSER